MIYQILTIKVLARPARRQSHTSQTSIDSKKTLPSNRTKKAQSRPLIGGIKVKMTNSKIHQERARARSLTLCPKVPNFLKTSEATRRALFNLERRASKSLLPG